MEKPGPTHRIILQFLVVHVNDVGTDTIQKVLGMGDEDQDALKPAKPEHQSGGRSEWQMVHNRWAECQAQKTCIRSRPYA